MARLVHRVLRARRRIAVSLGLLLAAQGVAGAAPVVPLPVVGPAGALVVAVGVSVALALRGGDRVRLLAESTALATVAFAILGRLFPGGMVDLGQPAPDFARAALAWAGLVAVATGALHGAWSDGLARRRPLRRTARATSRLDIHTLWYGLVPTPGHAEQYPAPGRVAIDQTEAERVRLHLLPQSPPQAPVEVVLHIFEIEAPFHIRCRLDVVSGEHAFGPGGIVELFLVDLGDHRLVLLTREGPAPPPRRRLADWLDDRLGQGLDQRCAEIERAAHARKGAGGRTADDTTPGSRASRLAARATDPAPPARLADGSTGR